MAHTSASILSRVLMESEQRVIIGSKYYHYRSPKKEYTVIKLALFEHDEKPAVIYTDGALTWVRDLDVWCEKVEYEGRLVDRFTKCE